MSAATKSRPNCRPSRINFEAHVSLANFSFFSPQRHRNRKICKVASLEKSLMNIVIIGAGSVGQYIASLLSKQNHNVILVIKIPKNWKKRPTSWISPCDMALDRIGSYLRNSWSLSPNLSLAMTDSDTVNFTACTIAKNLGYPLTIARVKDNRYLNNTRLDFARLFNVDYFIGPELLAANDIYKYMLSPGSLALENFAHGAVQMRTLAIPAHWCLTTVPLRELGIPPGIVVGIIRRKESDPHHAPHGIKSHVIFPHGSDTIKPGDEVTFIGETERIANIHKFFGIETTSVKSVVIVGGSLVGLNLAQILSSHGYNVRLIDKDPAVCAKLSERLPKCTIINNDATDLDFLKSEKIDRSNLFAVCTNNDEVNILTAFLGKEAGCDNVVVTLFNTSYVPLLTQKGIAQIVSPRISAANHIISLAISGRITSLTSLYENTVEILEITVSPKSKITGMPLVDLGHVMPKDFLIAMIQNRGQIMIANGNRIISPGDSVIVITKPERLDELKKIF